MSKYIDDTSCPQCDDYKRPYGCTNAGCPIRIDYDNEMEERVREEDERFDDE